MKTLFICFVLTFPIVFIISLGADIFGASDETKNTVSTVVFWLLIAAGVGWSLVRNVRSVGLRRGVIFTVFSAVCVVSACLAVFLLIIALFTLFLQVLITVAAIAAIFFIFTNGMGKGSSVADALAHPKKSEPKIYFDEDGNQHSNAAARESANRKIAERKNGGSQS